MNSKSKEAIQEPSTFKQIATTIIMFAALVGLGVLGWFAMEESRSPSATAMIPMIKANTEPYKIAPEDPGGMDVPFRDKEVYSTVSPKEKDDKVIDISEARMAPPPEKPVEREVIRAMEAPEKPVLSKRVTKDAMPLAVNRTADAARKAIAIPQKKPDLKLIKLSALDKPGNAGKKTRPGAVRAKPAIASKPKAVKQYRIQLGAYTSKNGLQKGWNILKAKFPKELASMTRHDAPPSQGRRGKYYRLQVGYLPTKDAAKSLCDTLIAKKQECIVATD